MAEAFHGVGVTRVRAGVRTDDRDRAATEEPLEVRLHDKPFAVIMRTPGADRELNVQVEPAEAQSIESLNTDLPPLVVRWTVPSSTIVQIPDRLREAQAVFDETGGLHASGLFTQEGRLETIAEDVGRHNAVDKVVGRMVIQERLPLTGNILFVSGRTSFEIVQKAFLAGIPMVAAVSAPSSLAIDLAEECGITLIGFLRGQNFNIYTHPERVTT